MDFLPHDGETEEFFDVMPDFDTYEIPEDPTADFELEEFFKRLMDDGSLFRLRDEGRSLALSRRSSLLSLDFEGGSSSEVATEQSSEFDDRSTITDLDDRDRDSDIVRRNPWPLNLNLRLPLRKRPHFGEIFQDGEPIQEGPYVTDEDLDLFLRDVTMDNFTKQVDGWHITTDREADTFSYKSWVRDPPNNSSTQYFSKMTINECSTDVMRNFLLDESYREEWDNARASSSTLEDWDEKGCQVIHWVRKLPFFLRDREYVASRKVWSMGDGVFACVAKTTTHPSAPKKVNPWPVSFFLSCWYLRGVETNKSSGCEIINFHQEESGLPRKWARVAVHCNIWPHVMKMERALRQYQKEGRNVKHLLPMYLVQADFLEGRA